jgi:hypothetical protein
VCGVGLYADRGEVDYVVPMFDIHCVCSSPLKLKFRFRDDTIIFVSCEQEWCGCKEVAICHTLGNSDSFGYDGPSHFPIV